MSVHPQFNIGSSCLNCAAFVPDVVTKSGVVVNGSCHRHAPRPFSAWTTRNVEEDGEEVDEPSREAAFPRLDDVMFCCEWIPGFPEEKKA